MHLLDVTSSPPLPKCKFIKTNEALMLPKLNADQIPGMHLSHWLSLSAPESKEGPLSAGDRGSGASMDLIMDWHELVLDLHTITCCQIHAEMQKTDFPCPHSVTYPLPARPFVLSVEEALMNTFFLRHTWMPKSHLYFLSDHQAERRGVGKEEWHRG